jgi:hypothetical protein
VHGERRLVAAVPFLGEVEAALLNPPSKSRAPMALGVVSAGLCGAASVTSAVSSVTRFCPMSNGQGPSGAVSGARRLLVLYWTTSVPPLST